MPASRGGEDGSGDLVDGQQRPAGRNAHDGPAAARTAGGSAGAAGAADAGVPSAAPSGGEMLTDQEIQQAVSKAYVTLRKEYSIQQRQWAAEQLAAGAARRRPLLARRAAARAAADAPTTVALQAAGGLPLAGQRGAGVAPFERARAEMETLLARRQQQRRRQRRHDAAGEASEAGPASKQQQAPGGDQQQGAAGDAGSDMEGASDSERPGDHMDVDGPSHLQPAAAAAAAAGGGRQQGTAAPADPASQRPVPAIQVAAVKSTQNLVSGKPDPLQALVLPTLPGVPFYKAWGWLKRNVLSLETGKRQFYTDDKGETVPVSDDEADGEAQLEQRELLGRHRDKYDHILKEVVARFGSAPAVFDTLHERLHISAAALEQRAAVLAAEAAGVLQQQQSSWDHKQDLTVLDEDMHSAWCRICRTFACRIHKGGHVRPVLGPMHAHEEPRRPGEPKPAANQPCGRRCYLLHTGQGGAQPAPAAGQQQQQQQQQGQHQQQGQQQEPLHQQLQRQQLGGDDPDALSYGSSPGGGGWRRQQPRPRQAAQQQQGRGRQAAGGEPAGEQEQQAQQPQRAPEVEVTSPPTKLPRPPSGGPLAPQPPSAGGAAAAAAAAAANAPLRRRRSDGSGGSGSGGMASSSGAPVEQEGDVIALLDTSDDEPAAGAAAAAAGLPWSAWEDALLQQGLEIWGREPCKIATLVGSRSCRQVHARLQEVAGPDGDDGQGANGQGGEEVQQRRGKGRKQAKVQVKRPPAVAERAKRRTDQMWPQYFACGCVGVCRSDCPCTRDANFCEKFCGCDPAKCGNRFPGCVCKSVGRRCASKLCPCLAAGRECDPDLCKMCKPTITGEQPEGMQCHNFRLRLGQKKRVLMGLSDIQGWGAFLQQPAAKDEFVGEYCGELINHEEADRRGTVYDRDDNSYLFNLNLEWVIDARQQGNTLRFANHSTNANCRAEILMVDGDHRVAIVTNREMREGEELFYNYRYDKRVAPDWAAGAREEGERPRVAQKQGAKRHGSRGGGGSGGSDRD